MCQTALRSECGAHPIVGDWTYTHYTGGLALMRYSRTGIVQLAVPSITVNGTYRLNQNSVVIELQSKKPTSSKFKKTDNSLVLTDNENRESKFVRFDY